MLSGLVSLIIFAWQLLLLLVYMLLIRCRHSSRWNPRLKHASLRTYWPHTNPLKCWHKFWALAFCSTPLHGNRLNSRLIETHQEAIVCANRWILRARREGFGIVMPSLSEQLSRFFWAVQRSWRAAPIGSVSPSGRRFPDPPCVFPSDFSLLHLDV